jgi:plastocyanin
MKLALPVVVLLSARAAAAGVITGVVRADPPPAAPAAAKITKDVSVCGSEAARDRLVLGPGGALANVVVAIKGLRPAQPPAATSGAAVDQVGCRYLPHVQAVTVGTTLAVLNNDAVLHNVHATAGGAQSPVTLFNLAMPFRGQKLPTVLRRPGITKLRCDAGHTWMSAYIHVFDHPYFAVTDQSGRFTIKDLPPGKHTVEYWHEPLDDQKAAVVKTVEVEVTGDKPAPGDLTLKL